MVKNKLLKNPLIWIIGVILVFLIINQNTTFQGALSSGSLSSLISVCEDDRDIYDCGSFYCMDTSSSLCASSFSDCVNAPVVHTCPSCDYINTEDWECDGDRILDAGGCVITNCADIGHTCTTNTGQADIGASCSECQTNNDCDLNYQCINGGCEPNTMICTDTDGGLNYNEFGRVTITDRSGTESYEDECADAKRIREYFCNADKTLGLDASYTCSGDCLNGECRECEGVVCTDPATVSCGTSITPNPGCTGPCQAGTKCPSGKTCEAGVCVVPEGDRCEGNLNVVGYEDQYTCVNDITYRCMPDDNNPLTFNIGTWTPSSQVNDAFDDFQNCECKSTTERTSSYELRDLCVVVVPPSCGDGTCDSGETCNNCEADCDVCPPTTTCLDSDACRTKGECVNNDNKCESACAFWQEWNTTAFLDSEPRSAEGGCTNNMMVIGIAIGFLALIVFARKKR